MLTGWQTIDGLLYYFDASGAMAADWTKLDGYWYYFNNEGKLMTGWMQLDGKFYYLHTDGRMVIGWQSDGTNKYYMDTVSGVNAARLAAVPPAALKLATPLSPMVSSPMSVWLTP